MAKQQKTINKEAETIIKKVSDRNARYGAMLTACYRDKLNTAQAARAVGIKGHMADLMLNCALAELVEVLTDGVLADWLPDAVDNDEQPAETPAPAKADKAAGPPKSK